MSAYVVTTDTIDYILTAANKYDAVFHAPASPITCDAATLAGLATDYSGNTYRISGDQSDLLGAILLAANLRSVNFRYPNGEPETADPYVYRTVSFSLIDPIVVLKSIACLEYQSCETDDYYQTFAFAILQIIRAQAIAHLAGYRDAPWGWTRQHEADRQQKAREAAARAINGGAR